VLDPNEPDCSVAWAGHDETVNGRNQGHFSSSEGTWQENVGREGDQEGAPTCPSTTYRRRKFSSLAKCTPIRVFGSLAVFPLMVPRQSNRVLALYTSKPEFFDAAGLLFIDRTSRQCRVRLRSSRQAGAT